MSSLPWGVTDAMCDGDDDPCARCGHVWSEHLDEDDYIYNSYGEVVVACDNKYCQSCEGYLEGEYIPSWQPDTYAEYYG